MSKQMGKKIFCQMFLCFHEGWQMFTWGVTNVYMRDDKCLHEGWQVFTWWVTSVYMRGDVFTWGVTSVGCGWWWGGWRAALKEMRQIVRGLQEAIGSARQSWHTQVAAMSASCGHTDVYKPSVLSNCCGQYHCNYGLAVYTVDCLPSFAVL